MNYLMQFLYGNGTRSIRTFNLFYHIIWIVLLALHINNVLIVNIPATLQPSEATLLVLCTAVVLFSSSSLLVLGRKRTLFKYFSLLLGTVVQVFIALKYFSNYPPFSPMVLFSTLISCWFIGGAVYIKKANDRESKYGIHREQS